jgi:SAM-dependent methyltransferase
VTATDAATEGGLAAWTDPAGSGREAPAGIYAAALRRAAAGQRPVLDVVDTAGRRLGRWHPAQWTDALRPGDAGLLSRCGRLTLDVGCGPGRLAAALTRSGRSALGVDLSAEAVHQARRRGAPAVRASVFDRLPREGAWRHVLLADGNIGIGGDPVALLRRCATLLAPGGGVLAEVAVPGQRTWATDVVLRDGARRSAAFRWAAVGADDLAALACRAGLDLLETWTEAGRWFAQLGRN